MRRPIAIPKWLYTPNALNAMPPEKMDGWEPDNVSWMTTSIDLAKPQGYDFRFDHFDCLVQYRVNALDNLQFNGVRAGELVVPKTDRDGKLATLLEVAEQVMGTSSPDNGLSLGRIVTIDAIYHQSWVAIPYIWACSREAVLGDEAWEPLIKGMTIEQIKSGSTVLTKLSNVTSSRIAMYLTAHHAMWRVGLESFHVPVLRRPSGHSFNPNRMSDGWTETVAKYEHPPLPEVPIDPPRRLKGRTMRPLEGAATEAMHSELAEHGISTEL